MLTAIEFSPFWLSLRVATLATALVAVVGVPTAWMLARLRFRGKSILSGALTLPLVLPPTVLGYGLLLLLGKRGPIGIWLEATWGVTLVFHWTGAAVATAVASFPLFLLPARGAIEGVDVGLEEAARLLGASEWGVFGRVTLPLAWRGLVAGGVLAFARSLGDFGATLMVAGDIPGRTRTASLAIYDAVQSGDANRAAAYSALIAVVSILAASLAQKALSPRSA